MNSRSVLRSILRRCENAAVTTLANNAGSVAVTCSRSDIPGMQSPPAPTFEKSTGIMRTMAESTLGGGLKAPGGTMNMRSMW